ncbi:MAG: hypothetical protein KA831_08385 [Pyrinomonadaceae bacterium]|nr:hypothetical protein [Pyrinomonadaceae bacterium]
MPRSYLIRITLFVCLACLLTLATPVRTDAKPGPRKKIPTNAAAAKKQGQFAAIIVNGRTLTGPNSNAVNRNGRVAVPVMAVARALGDTVSVDAAGRRISVKRQTGEIADLDARLGQVRENGSVMLTVSNAGELIFTPNADQMILPAEIASTLFDAAIRYDDAQNAVLITRGGGGPSAVQSVGGRSVAELYNVDYEYNLNRYSSLSSHNIILTGVGRVGDGRFYFTSNASKSSSQSIRPRNFTFILERPNGQRFTAGDFGTGTALQFLSANVRGGMFAIPIGRFVVTAFAGRANSGTVVTPLVIDGDPLPQVITAPRYDTNVFGFSVSTASANSRRVSPWTLAAGAMRFAGPSRKGDVYTASANYNGSRFRLQSDAAFGKFNGFSSDGLRINGTAPAIDFSATYQIADSLSVQGRYAFIGRNFLSPQTGARDPLDLKAAGVNWSPRKWLSTSFNASVVKRPGDQTKQDRSATVAIAITPGGTHPRFYFSHTQNSSIQARSSAFSLFNASKDFSRWRVFMNATRVKTLGTATSNAQFGANFLINDTNSLEVSQGIGSKRSLTGLIDWRTSNLLGKRLSFTAGAGYSYGQNSKFSAYERITASLTLPRQTSLQVSYMNTNAGPTLLVSIKGSLFRKRESSVFLNAPLSEVNSFAKVSGRVYQDVDMNGRFDAGVDKPQADVKVQVDGNRYVLSDSAGQYSFDAVLAGDHKVFLDLMSVRADLTLLSGGEHAAALKAGSSSTVDFRLVRTGRLRGRVWLDANENGKFDEGEKPLADVRVVTASGRDTLTDADGFYVIGDLAPGEHVILIDEKTLPEKTRSAAGSLSMEVFPGRETSDVALAVIFIPAEVKRFGTKTN